MITAADIMSAQSATLSIDYNINGMTMVQHAPSIIRETTEQSPAYPKHHPQADLAQRTLNYSISFNTANQNKNLFITQ